MDKMEIEKYRRNLELLESQLTNSVINSLSQEQIREYVILATQIRARLEILENMNK